MVCCVDVVQYCRVMRSELLHLTMEHTHTHTHTRLQNIGEFEIFKRKWGISGIYFHSAASKGDAYTVRVHAYNNNNNNINNNNNNNNKVSLCLWQPQLIKKRWWLLREINHTIIWMFSLWWIKYGVIKEVNIYPPKLKERNQIQKGSIRIKSSMNWLANTNLLKYFKMTKI
jgi:hypothetical protein